MSDRSVHVLVAVTGGIAAYKTADLVSRMIRRGWTVDVVMTPAATEFVRPLTFEALTGRDVFVEPFAPALRKPEHVALAERPRIAVVAPATANTLAKIVHGIADNLLAAALLACRKPMLVAPAMNSGMWDAPATRENMKTLAARGVHVIGPEEGRLACGDVGMGRMSSPEAILDRVDAILESTP